METRTIYENRDAAAHRHHPAHHGIRETDSTDGEQMSRAIGVFGAVIVYHILGA